MSKLTINEADLASARNFLIQYLRDAGYEGTLDDGTALYDLLIKGMSLLYTLFKTEADRASAYLSVQRALDLSDLLGEELDTAVDNILSNWFVERKPGSPARGTLRLVFAKPLDFISFSKSDMLATIQGVDFYPDTDLSYFQTDFTSVAYSAEFPGEAYLDVPVVAAVSDDTPIEPGATVTAYVSSIYFLRGVVSESFTLGTNQEDSETFVERTRKAITTRELISNRSIYTVLMDVYSELKDVYVAGHGAAEQLRDVITFDNITVHVGNKADIFLHVLLNTRTATIEADTGGSLVLQEHAADVLELLDDQDNSLTFSLATKSEPVYGAVGEPNEILSAGILSGQTYRVRYLSSDTFPAVDSFVRSEDQLVASYDPIVRSKFPVVLDLSIAVKQTPGQSLTEDQLIYKLRMEVIDYVRSIAAGDTFTVSDMVHALHAAVPEITSVTLPVSVSYGLRDPETLEIATGTVAAQFSIPGTASNLVTLNTIQFHTELNRISITVE